MQKPTFFVSFGDILIIFLYGFALTYYCSFMNNGVDMRVQIIASGVLALVLGSLGPSPGELIEWALFFALGVFTAALFPQIMTFQSEGTYSIESIIQTCFGTVPYFKTLMTGWAFALPPGLLFAKVNDRFTQRNYYRHARFF